MIPQGRLNVQEVTRAIGMLQTGMSQDTDGKLMNRSLTVSCGKGLRKHDQSRKGLGVEDHAATARQDRQLVLQAKQNRFNSAFALNSYFCNPHTVQISNQTCWNRIHEPNLKARRLATPPILTADHRVRRLEFARDNRN